MIIKILECMVGTIAFCILFGVPRRYYIYCGFIGVAAWLASLFVSMTFGRTIGSLAAAAIVVWLSRFMAVRKECPVTLFLIAGIIPLVPGGDIYRTIYYLVTNQFYLAIYTGYQAVKCAIAIVLGIVFIFELPQKVFLKSPKKK